MVRDEKGGQTNATEPPPTVPPPTRETPPAVSTDPTIPGEGSLDATLPASSALGGASGAGGLHPVEARRYEVGGEVARGGLGRILRARDVRLDRPVAIKELLRSAEQDRARFAREALVTARLQHPAI